MGAYSPTPLINKELEKNYFTNSKTHAECFEKKKKFYNGFLYVGLMIKDNNPYLIEYNIRMGDPECQVILPRLETDLVKIIKKATENKLNEVNIRWKKEKV